MFQSNFGKTIFYSCCVIISYTVSSFVSLVSKAQSEYRHHTYIELDGLELLYISLAIGFLSCLDAVRISKKVRRILVFTCVSYVFMNAYAALLRISDQNQLNLLESLLRKKLNFGIILGSEFLLILVTKTILYSVFQEIIKTLYRMITGPIPQRVWARRGDYIYAPKTADRRNRPQKSSLKNVRFSN